VVRKEYSEPIEAPDLSFKSWLRWIWRQLTSMRIALILLLLLALAAIPGSLYPQRSADPNGVILYFKNNPGLAAWLDGLQLFDVYSSSWFSSIYLLLFISLIGCVIPRVGVHYKALIAPPPEPPTSLSRLPAYKLLANSEKHYKLSNAEKYLKAKRFRVVAEKGSIRAEKGYIRETGNILFHTALIGVLISVGLGNALSFSAQRVLVEGETFVNNEAGFDSFTPGLLFDSKNLTPFSITLDKFSTTYDYTNPNNYGRPLDFIATVTSKLANQTATNEVIRVNNPLQLPNSKVYLTGNGYAPVIVLRDADGRVSFSGPVVFLPQDSNLTSLGVIKNPDAKPMQYGMLAFFYPTPAKLKTGALTSGHPEIHFPLLTMNVYVGNLGLDSGIASNAFDLQTHGLKQVAGGKSKVKAIELKGGEIGQLPQGLGTVEFKGVKRFASLDITYNPGELYVLLFAILTFLGLIMMLITPRRRVWIRKTPEGIEVGALAKTRDESLPKLVKEITKAMKKKD
jgi:cytochrome c biogenesis protein